jgi:ubiquinone/menaquinone biosynthesis C-methylase UbiE
MQEQYEKMVDYYDALYSFKDYREEADKLHQLICKNKCSDGMALLDVACGTGQHLFHLEKHYQVEGLDLNPQMLEIARQRCAEVLFHQGNMLDFELGRRFDVVTCLFSSIGYVKNLAELKLAINNMACHLLPGGVLIVEPWLSPDNYISGGPHALFVDEPELKIARMNISEEHDGVAILNMHHLVARPEGIEYFVERHELVLFTDEQYRQAFEASGLGYIFDPHGLTGRNLLIGLQPMEREAAWPYHHSDR